MHDEIIFSPDPRTDQNDLIGVDDTNEYDSINIYLHSNDADGSVAGLLEHRKDGFYYEILLYDKREKSFNDKLVFTDTYNINDICDEIERWFDNGRLQAHLVVEEKDGKKEEYYVLIFKRSSETNE